jgi:hypothetical protein
VLLGWGGGGYYGKRQIVRPKYRREDDIKMEQKYMGCEGVHFIRLAQCRVKRRALEKTVINLCVP